MHMLSIIKQATANNPRTQHTIIYEMTIKQKGSNRPAWSALKRELTGLEQRELLALIRDLYAANKDNQTFLQARFALADDVLEPYKKTISRWICPDVMRHQNYSVAKAKKAITEYRRAVGQPDGLAELSVYYCESCADFLDSCGMDDDGYFDAWTRMYEKALKTICQLDNEQQEGFIERLEQVRFRESCSWDPFVVSAMDALMEQYRFDEKG